jgi:hypothetical protein
MERDELFLTERDILERVDEYALYCHYLEFEPQFGVKYSSPLRELAIDADDRPSFGVFKSKYHPMCEFMWKDQGKGVHGDIFDLVAGLYRISRATAKEKIEGDLGLGPGIDTPPKLRAAVPKPQVNFRIRIKSRPFNEKDLKYWSTFGIDLPVLKYYNVTAVAFYWTFEEQPAPRFPRTPCYAYRIWDHYKLYNPFEQQDFKFRNDYDERHLEGYCQLKFNSDLLIITKAMKDVMMLRSMGYEAVAPRGEHTMIPENFINMFKSRYKYIIVIMDNDGKNKAPEYLKLYNIPNGEVPISSGEKDPTDYRKVYGAEATEYMLNTILHGTFGTRSFIRSFIQG